MSITLSPGAVKLAAQEFNDLAVVLPVGATFEDALRPEFWANNVKPFLSPISRVTIILYDQSEVMDAIVCASGRGFARLKEIQRITLSREAAELQEEDPVLVRYGNISTRWQIIRRRDGCVLKEGIRDKGDALREAVTYSAIAA